MDGSLESRAEQLAEEFASSATTVQDLNQLMQLMRLMLKSGLERMLNTEMDVHLGRKGPPESAAPAAKEAKRSGNRRNGRSQKTLQGELGEVTLSTPRDRNGTFKPKIIGPIFLVTGSAPHPRLRREDSCFVREPLRHHVRRPRARIRLGKCCALVV